MICCGPPGIRKKFQHVTRRLKLMKIYGNVCKICRSLINTQLRSNFIYDYISDTKLGSTSNQQIGQQPCNKVSHQLSNLHLKNEVKDPSKFKSRVSDRDSQHFKTTCEN